MNPIDEPAILKFNNGNTLPSNFKMIMIVVLVAGAVFLLLRAFILGAILLLVGLFTLSQQQIVEINEDKNVIHDYSLHFGFLKIGKKYPLDKYMYITAMPLVESANVMANLALSATISNSYHAITMFGNRFKGKRIVTKFETKSQAQEQAKKLADRLKLKYFDYDPKLVREVLLGHHTL
jgi:hypothetical protein